MADPIDTQAPDTSGNPADTATQTDTTKSDDTTKQDDTSGNGTIITDDKTTTAKPDQVTPDWPEDWRDKLAKGDDKVRKRLDRFQSPADVLKSWQSLEQKLSSGDVKSRLPDNATDEQIADYRKEHGIPDKAEGYLENLPNGLVIGDDDKELVGSYVERVHGKNADPAVVAETLDWYYGVQEEQIAKQAQADADAKQKFDDELRSEWGNEYRQNINSINSFLDTAPADDDGTALKDLLLGSRLSDGTPIGNHPTMLRWLARVAADANPAGFVSPGAGLSQIDSVNDEIASIEKSMRTNRAAYNKDEKMQARYLELLSAREKIGARA